jgi:molecular chaperone HscC
MIIGIDLGTTNSLAALWRGGEALLVPNALGAVLTPSAVSIGEDGATLVGQAARDRLSTRPHRSAASFKRAMGTDHVFELAGRPFRAEELSASVLHGST